VALRVLTLLVAVVMMVGATSPVDVPVADDVASAVDAAPDVPVPPAVTPTIAEPPHVVIGRSDVPSTHAGRFHAVTVFRPPRLFASR
jgi:hypothetical protein